MNPIDILYAWQSALLAAVIVGLTQAFKAGIEAWLTFRNNGTTKTGKELRGEITLIDRALLPLFPLVMGAMMAAFIPIRPEALTQYVTEHGHGSRWAYAMWGAAVGQFADYLYQRVKRLLPQDRASTASDPQVAPDAPAPSQEPTVAPTEPTPAAPPADPSGPNPVG
jgi:hypothetical protein